MENDVLVKSSSYKCNFKKIFNEREIKVNASRISVSKLFFCFYVSCVYGKFVDLSSLFFLIRFKYVTKRNQKSTGKGVQFWPINLSVFSVGCDRPLLINRKNICSKSFGCFVF